MTIVGLTLFIILATCVLDISLSVLTLKHRHQPLPESIQDIYDPEEYDRWMRYSMENHRLSMVSQTLHTLLLLGFFLLGVFPRLDNLTTRLTSDPILQSVLFLGAYALVMALAGIGFSWYRTFSIEQRYGFNRSTPRTFLLDRLKSFLLTLLLGGPLLYGLFFLYVRWPQRFVLYAWIGAIVVSLTVNILYTRLFIRLFNRLTPLEDGPLKDRLTSLAATSGYELKKISLIDASRRSTKLNAFFSGFGRFRQIVLFDTLLDKCTTDQVVSVVAHEIGHAKHKDTLRNFGLGLVQSAVLLGLLSLFLSTPSLSRAFGFPGVHLGFVLILMGILLEPVSVLLQIPLTALSRRAEYRADRYAALSGYREAMIGALKVLARENFANLTPHPLVVRLTYSHPPVSNRIDALEDLDLPADATSRTTLPVSG